MIEPLISITGMALVVICFFRWLYKENVADMETAEAVALLVDRDMCVSFKGWHVWRGAKDEYVLLQFDSKSNALDNTEERFPATADGRNDAAAKFVQRTKKE